MFKCNFCGEPLEHVFADLGFQPPSNSFLTKEQLLRAETYYPLTAYVCSHCWLVQVPEVKKATEIFNDEYVYFSSESPANVSHAKEYVDMITERFHPKTVLEIGSNDGYMLQFFKEKGCKILGIDPAVEPSNIAHSKGLDVECSFFNTKLIKFLGEQFDLICGINVLAHQPDINDFVKGLKIALAPEGVITFEFPHLMRTVEGMQFDQIYLEHFSYFSLNTIFTIFDKHGLELFDVDELPEHGGSLRIYAQHKKTISGWGSGQEKVSHLINVELDKNMCSLDYYANFNKKVQSMKHEFMEFLYHAKSIGETVIGYGAPAKGNTFLNFCGIKPDLIPCIIDRSPHKQGKFAPGSHIPVVSEEEGMKFNPDYILILPWNLKEEISKQLKYTEEWGCKLITAVPSMEGVYNGKE